MPSSLSSKPDARGGVRGRHEQQAVEPSRAAQGRVHVPGMIGGREEVQPLREVAKAPAGGDWAEPERRFADQRLSALFAEL